MQFSVGINVSIDAIYDTETDCFDIISCKPQIVRKNNVTVNEWMEHILTKTQVKFGIITLGSRSTVGCQIPLEEVITVQLVENEIVVDEKQLITHKKIRGRIDGLTSMYYKTDNLFEGKKVKLRYIYKDKILQLKV